jgi:hypothetical protein
MSEAYTGGCACGAIRYEVASEPIASNHCHCRDCQMDSGTGHSSYLAFVREGLTITGAPAGWDMMTDRNGVKTRNFCATCGSPVFLSFADMPDIVAIRAGTLDDPRRFVPGFVSYTARAYDWDRVDPALAAFAKMPPGP